MSDVTARAGAGTLAITGGLDWGDGRTTVETRFTGMHLTHLAIAGCVLNDTYREAAALGIQVDGVRVEVRGAFDMAAVTFGPVDYTLVIDAPEPRERIAELERRVESVAEVPQALARSLAVRKVDG
ncbi:OsmC family protein [Demequina phytophila]|uniref:OsmC family protein n=1 Tax=Demequina phytophila TaxID=1638981 RepID=UPI00078551C1|nr:OsmC family protein [Demequina phytophila]